MDDNEALGRVEMDVGYSEGDICNRNGCKGEMVWRPSDDNCSCHINPPCPSCYPGYVYCSVCDWDEEFDADVDV